jgi:hypothetical protein
VNHRNENGPVLTPKDKERIAATVAKMNELGQALELVMPEVEKEQIGVLVHDIVDLWEFAKVHDERVAEIVAMKGTQDRHRLAVILDDLLYGDALELEYHIESIREYVAKPVEMLEK